MDDLARRMRSYIDSLQEEKLKIQVFHRELPLCLDLINKAIENYRHQLSGTTTATDCLRGHSECSEQTSTRGPVLEQFIPIKKPCSSSDDDEDEDAELDSGRGSSDLSDNKTKSDWLRSAQLWNQTAPDPPPKDDHPLKRVPVLEVKRSGGAFRPFNREQSSVFKSSDKNKPSSVFSPDEPKHAVPAASDIPSAGTSGHKEDREAAQQNRKQRRNWSPELHRRFLRALEQLGGSHAATPKQIRELMKVDGLTNDEVKSHLQKYRLHTRRPGPSSSPIPAAAGAAPSHQFVVVGGIWVPPLPSSAAPTPANSCHKKDAGESEGRGSHSAGGEEETRGARSNSPSSSSSSHTKSRRRH